MSQEKNVLIVGIDPYLIDFSTPEYAAFPGLTADKVAGAVKGTMEELGTLGYQGSLCWTDFGPTAISTLEKFLKDKKWNGILIGAGIRIPAANFELFEKMINTIHLNAPDSKIIFNSNPMDTVTSVKRWI